MQNMKKIVLLLGRNLRPKFHQHIVAVNPEFESIECSFQKDPPEKYKESYLYIPKGKEFETITTFCEDKKVVGVINRKDYYEKLHGELVDYFEVPGPAFHAIDQVSNKANLHNLMKQLNLQLFRARTIVCQLSEVRSLLKSVQFPVIIKPFAGAHSRGVYKLESSAAFDTIYPLLYEHFKKEYAANTFDKDGQTVLIEEYLGGKMTTPLCYVDAKGKVHFISLVKITHARDIGQKHNQLIFRTMPSNAKEQIQQKMKFVLQKIVKATGLKETFLDPEFFVQNGHIYLIEINVRMGGFRQELAKPAFGIDLEKMVTALALGEEFDDSIEDIASATGCEIWEEQSGIISKVSIPKSKHILDSKLNFVVGDYYDAPPLGNIPLGIFYVKASEKSLKIAKQIRSKVKIEFKS